MSDAGGMPQTARSGGRPGRAVRRRRIAWLARIVPRTLQARLTLAFVGVVVLTLGIVSVVVINRVDDYFASQTQADLAARTATVFDVVKQNVARGLGPTSTVVDPEARVNPLLRRLFQSEEAQRLLADQLAQANVRITIGLATRVPSGALSIVARPEGTFTATRVAPPRPGQSLDPITRTTDLVANEGKPSEYGIRIELSDPYTFRSSAVANVAGLLAVVGLLALALAVVVAAIAARRFAAPIRRLTEASRAIAEGEYSRRVPENPARTGAAELADLSRQFNAMAARLGESVEIIRRDRDRSRDFLADVSHELRTPIAALRTFNELLKEGASADPEAMAEFLESSAQQIDRLDWLATNLLELSKLESGLVLLDLRPDDLRACVESAVEQAQPAARRRGIQLELELPGHPLRIRHDPQRIGQVVSNLVGNALKFTPRGGRVSVAVRAADGGAGDGAAGDGAAGDGARIVVTDTGVGIDTAELPRIFDRFYRGSRANEARGSGSGLGLAIVKSIVDMHAGRVSVESLVGRGSTFTVTLPRDPRANLPEPGRDAAPTGEATVSESSPGEVVVPLTPVTRGTAGPTAGDAAPAHPAKMVDSSPSPPPRLNHGSSG
ncbi:MAG TPA: HAMP domain-containing sensor histidine kinase [Candidatus Limnocylindria bacterium]|nr:HAMP domain-containing sensor histidine kinase [Candidatus Limnocylindria bacterium]